MIRARIPIALVLCGLLAADCGDFAIEDFQYSVHVFTGEFTETAGASVVVTVDMGDAHRSMVLGAGHVFDDVTGYVGGEYRATAYVQTSTQLAELRARRDEIERKLGEASVIQGDLIALAKELREVSAAIANGTNNASSCGAEFKDAAPLPGRGRGTVQATVDASGTVFMVCG
jgi:hypothetical protein